MKTWLRRVRGAVGMGVTWAIAWALAGLLIGVSSILLPGLPWDAFFAFFDAPLPALAVPGFLGGAIFSVVLGIAGRRRRFDELSLPRFAAWGAVGGALLSLVPAASAAAGLLTGEGSTPNLWQVTAIISVPLILLSTLSAAGSLMLARRSENRRYGMPGEDGAFRLAKEQAPLLGAGEVPVHSRPAAGAPARVHRDASRDPGDA